MKLVLILFSLILLAVLFFGRTPASNASPAAQPASTSTPMSISTLAPPATVDTVSRDIYYYLNMAIEDMERSTKFNQLEHINGASYQVVYVGFQHENGVPVTLQVQTRCECAGNGDCCSPTHTFVITMQAMDEATYEPLILERVPLTVRNLEVLTFDHTIPAGGALVPWLDVVSFLQGTLDGFRLWFEVTPVPNP